MNKVTITLELTSCCSCPYNRNWEKTYSQGSGYTSVCEHPSFRIKSTWKENEYTVIEKDLTEHTFGDNGQPTSMEIPNWCPEL